MIFEHPHLLCHRQSSPRAYRRPRPHVCPKGFTLIELVISIAVIAIALSTLAFAMQFSVRESADPLWQVRSSQLAQSYMDEILSRRYDEQIAESGTQACRPCTSPAGLGPDNERRGTVAGAAGNSAVNEFDDIDDYQGLDESPRDARGQPLEHYRGYRVQVSVAYAGQSLGLGEDNLAKAIAVQVTPPGQTPLRFVAYRSNHR